MAKQAPESTGNAFGINIERARNIRIDGTGVAIKLDWEGLDKETQDKIRGKILSDAEDNIQKLEKDLKKEKKRCVKRMRSLAEGYAQLVQECDEKYGELTAQCKEVLQEMETAKLEAEQKERDLVRKIEQERIQSKKRAENAIRDFKAKQREKTKSYVLKMGGKTAKVQRQILEKIPDDKLRETVQRLHDELKIQILGIDTDFVFLINSVLGEEHVKKNQEEILKRINELIPKDVAREVRWSNIAALGDKFLSQDFGVGQRFPREVSELAESLKTSIILIKTGIVVGTVAGLSTAAAVGVGAGMAVGAVVAAPFVFFGAIGLAASGLWYGRRRGGN